MATKGEGFGSNQTPGVTSNMGLLSLDQSSGDGRRDRKKDDMAMIHSFLRTRPSHVQDKRGVNGEPVTCVANYLPVESNVDWLLYQYHVDFSPTVDSKVYRNKMLRIHEDTLGQEMVFDGAILFLPFPMDDCLLVSLHPNTGDKVHLTIKKTNELPPNSPQSLTLFNLCVRRAMQEMDFKQFGRYFFNPNKSAIIRKHKIEIWPGIISAIRLHEEQLLLCCEMAHKLLRTDSVLDVMKDIFDAKTDRFQEKCLQALIGVSVLTRYNNKTYRVDDIEWNMNPKNEFEMADGSKTSYIDYYFRQYNKTINDANQPLLISRVKNRGVDPRGKEQPEFIYLIPELCSMTGLTDQMRSDRRVMQDLAVYTRVPPAERVRHVENFVADMNRNENILQLFNSWKLTVGRGPLRLKARVLQQEAVLAGKKSNGDEPSLRYDPKVGDWAREARSYPVTDPKTMRDWVLVFPENDRQKAIDFFKAIGQIGRQIAMQIEEPYIVPLPDERVGTYLEGIKHGWTMAKKQPDMVVTMVPNDNKTRYDAIKKLCCLDKPVPNQVVRTTSMSKNLMSVCGKIILQMNCKLGGSLWKVHIPMKSCMVVGYDSYHDSSQRGKSVGSAVFSLNSEMTRWYSQCALHGENDELVGNLTRFCEAGLRKYHEVNGCLPNRILIYRSGCGDGQIPVVYNYELPQVQEAISKVGQKIAVDYKPRLSFIIVNKRVNTRFFEVKGEGQVANPRPGTVVDSGVTRPERYDFYLVPQCVNQGTVTPVSYNVIFDQSDLQPDHMQRLAFKLCHLYYNWQGTIRVPAPCQYAHKLAFLVGQSLHQPGDETLADKLYFL